MADGAVIDHRVTADLQVLDGAQPRPLSTQDLKGFRADLLGTQSFGAYHALAGRWFAASTDYVTGIPAAGEQTLAAFVNPADSGVAAFLDVGEFGADRNTKFRRYGGMNVTVNDGVEGPISRNTGGMATMGKARLLIPSQFALSTPLAPWSVRKTAHVLAFAQYTSLIFGASVVMPGAKLAWTLVGPESGGSGTVAASVLLEWVEIPVAALTAARVSVLALEDLS